MRRKQIKNKKLVVTLHDNARSTDWGFARVTKIVEQSLDVLESFLFSKNTIVNGKNHDEITLDIQFCGDRKMRSINNDFRGKDKTTDVLSFPLFESLRVGSDEFVFPGPIGIGDIVISREVAKKQAHEFSLKLEQEVIHLIVHGFLHLLGWDHEISEQEEVEMEAHEKALLEKIKKLRNK